MVSLLLCLNSQELLLDLLDSPFSAAATVQADLRREGVNILIDLIDDLSSSSSSPTTMLSGGGDVVSVCTFALKTIIGDGGGDGENDARSFSFGGDSVTATIFADSSSLSTLQIRAIARSLLPLIIRTFAAHGDWNLRESPPPHPSSYSALVDLLHRAVDIYYDDIVVQRKLAEAALLFATFPPTTATGEEGGGDTSVVF